MTTTPSPFSLRLEPFAARYGFTPRQLRLFLADNPDLKHRVTVVVNQKCTVYKTGPMDAFMDALPTGAASRPERLTRGIEAARARRAAVTEMQ